MPIGGSNLYPSLNTIANLARTLVNDDKPGATGTPGEGQILTNSSVTLQNLMNSAIRETARDCRITGMPVLIKDNYILQGITPVNSPLGVGAINPSVQVNIGANGYFDGLGVNPNLKLPGDLLFPLEMWERQSGTQNEFGIMHQSTGALLPRNQFQWLGDWEWRGDAVWMNGAILTTDVRLRYVSQFIDLASPSIDWNNTFVPIYDCQEAVADKISVRYARRLGGDVLQDAQMQADKSILRLKQEVVRAKQMIDYTRQSYGQNTAGTAGSPATWLY